MSLSRPAGQPPARSKVIRQYRFMVEGEVPEVSALETPGSDEAGPTAEIDPAIIRRQAEAEAERTLAAARQQGEEIRQKARADGYQEGREAGRREGLALAEAQAMDEVGRLHEVVENLINERGSMLAEVESDLVALAIAIARKVIGDAAENDPEVIMEMARRAVDALGRPSSYRIHVNPQDVARLAGYMQEQDEQRTWELVPDERVAPGGCTVTSGASIIDARPETQLALIQQSFSGM